MSVTVQQSGHDKLRELQGNRSGTYAAAIEVLKILTGFKVSVPGGETLPKAGKRKQVKRP